MDPRVENALLELALARGLVSATDLRRVGAAEGPAADRWGARLAALIDERVLSEEVLASLEGELTSPVDGTSGITVSLPGAAKAGGASVPGEPIAGSTWGRYDVLGPLGQGSMGRVVKAFDPLLARPVALKLLFGDEPSRVARFLLEARSQARVDHPNVCKIHEAAFVGERPYIAMQFVDGATLGRAAQGMTLLEKVEVMRQVAEGVHAAHRTGLIHRDLKPANILVERTADGALRPCVADFGLARDPEEEGLTVTGQTVGTPAYMSPEQARGEKAMLDRRSDVYSLGATLYELLAGRPPFRGVSGMDVMMKVIAEEPTALRKVQAGVPQDLETIAMKCLEKDPSRRYDSARALAEDLARYLDGEPIAAAPPSAAARLVKRARKHPAMTSIVVASLLLVVASAGFGTWSLLTSRQRARLAQRFGQDVREIEALVRASALSPAHDIRPEKAVVRARMKAIAEQMRIVGRQADGPGHEALGRGHLALSELDGAREHLEESIAASPDAPRVHHALGVTLGLLYQKGRDLVDSLPDPKDREEKRQALARELRKPALEHLRKGGGEEAAFSAALVAFHEDRYENAEGLATEALKGSPWLYEAAVLRADARAARALAAQEAGNLSGADALYASAESAYEAALLVGESDPRAHDGLCRLRSRRLQHKIFQVGGDVDAVVSKTLAACDAGLAVDPERPGLLVGKSAAFNLWGTAVAREGKDPSPILERSKESARKAVAVDPTNQRAWGNLGNAFLAQAQYVNKQRLDPRPLLADAIGAFERSLRPRPHPLLESNLGLALYYRAEYEASHGLDPRSSLGEAVKRYENARRLSPGFLFALNNEGLAEMTRGEWEYWHGVDPTASYRRGIDVLHSLVALSAEFAYGRTNLAATLKLLADFEARQGREVTALLDEAETHAAKAIAINPSNPNAHEILGLVLVARAEAARRAGRDPAPIYAAAEASLRKGEALDPEDAQLKSSWLSLLRSRARARAAAGRDPSPEVAPARAIFAAATRVNPDFAGPYIELSGLLVEKLRFDVEKGRPAAAGADIVELLTRAIALTSDSSDAHRLLGEAELLRARAAKRLGKDAAPSLANAERALLRSKEINALDPETPLLLADVRREREGGPATSSPFPRPSSHLP